MIKCIKCGETLVPALATTMLNEKYTCDKCIKKERRENYILWWNSCNWLEKIILRIKGYNKPEDMGY